MLIIIIVIIISTTNVVKLFLFCVFLTIDCTFLISHISHMFLVPATLKVCVYFLRVFPPIIELIVLCRSKTEVLNTVFDCHTRSPPKI